jgi:hypothetical protein
VERVRLRVVRLTAGDNPPSIAMIWYRVEFDADGNRVSCEAAAPAGQGGNVFFVEASSVEAAWRKAHSMRTLALQRTRAADRKAAGKCPRCGVGKYDGTTRCAEYCKPEDTKRGRNLRTAAGGSKVPVREIEPQLTRDERLRLQVLQECMAAWRSPRNFHQWITGEIAALTTKLRKAG